MSGFRIAALRFSVGVVLGFLSCCSINRRSTSLFVRALNSNKRFIGDGSSSSRRQISFISTISRALQVPATKSQSCSFMNAASIDVNWETTQKTQRGGSSSKSLMEIVGSTALSATTNLAGFASRYSRLANAPVYNGDDQNDNMKMNGDDQKLQNYENTDKLAVTSALATIERDMGFLDDLSDNQTQVSTLEFTMLTVSVLTALLSPSLFSANVVEVLAPAAAAFSGLIGVGAEYVGRVAVADAKEIASVALVCAAEAEGLLANAERSKAIMPLAVGISATATTFSLLAPVLFENISTSSGIYIGSELFLLAPLVSILAAAVASLALQETILYSKRSIGVGNRRFSKSGMVGRTWKSATEQIQSGSRRSSKKFQNFGVSVLPAPIIGVIVPGSLSTKAIVIAALAAAQTAYFTAQAEDTLARATDAVAIKSRSAAISDTYANQGARSVAILPYTSALGALCAAATAALVELPIGTFVHNIFGPTNPAGLITESIIIATFPALAAFSAAAASVSKARCKVDAEAASQAASTLSLQYDDASKDPVLRPFRGVITLLILSLKSGWRTAAKSTVFLRPLWKRLASWLNPS